MTDILRQLVSRRAFTLAVDKVWLLLFLTPRPSPAQSNYCINNCNDQYVTCGDSSWCGGSGEVVSGLVTSNNCTIYGACTTCFWQNCYDCDLTLVECCSHFVTILRRTSVYFQEKGLAILA